MPWASSSTQHSSCCSCRGWYGIYHMIWICSLLTKYMPMQLDLDDQMNEKSLLLDSFHSLYVSSLFWPILIRQKMEDSFGVFESEIVARLHSPLYLLRNTMRKWTEKDPLGKKSTWHYWIMDQSSLNTKAMRSMGLVA